MTNTGFTQPGPYPPTTLTTLDVPPSPVNKPGPQTTEFWTLIAHYGVAVFITIMSFWHPGYSLPGQWQALVDALVPAAAAFSMAIAHRGYSLSRAAVKSAGANAENERQARLHSLTLQQQEFEHQKTMVSLQYVASTPSTEPVDAPHTHPHRTPKS